MKYILLMLFPTLTLAVGQEPGSYLTAPGQLQEGYYRSSDSHNCYSGNVESIPQEHRIAIGSRESISLESHISVDDDDCKEFIDTTVSTEEPKGTTLSEVRSRQCPKKKSAVVLQRRTWRVESDHIKLIVQDLAHPRDSYQCDWRRTKDSE